jgi:hypothetical protein
MSLAVSSVMSQAHGWVNNNLGWVTVGAAAATVAVTLSYVYWTWRLLAASLVDNGPAVLGGGISA